MSKKSSQATAPANQPIKLETVYPIQIKDKTGGFSLATPGETIEYEELDTVKIIMLAHKFNEMVVQMHRMQKVIFANNKMLAELLEQKNGQAKKQ